MAIESENGRCYLSRVQAAKYLGVSARMFDIWVAKKQIPVIRAGRRVMTDRQDLGAFYASLKMSAPA